MPDVLIPDYPSQAVMSAARSLGRSGDRVTLVSSLRRADRLGRSRLIDEWVATTSGPLDVDGLIEMLRERKTDVLFAGTPDSTVFIAANRARLEGEAAFLVPSLEAFTIANDKLRTVELCRMLGIPVPGTWVLDDDAALARAAGEATFPAVLKPRVSRGADGLHFIRTADDLRRAWDELQGQEAAATPTPAFDYSAPILQEYLPGVVHDACSVAHHGEVVNVVTQERHIMRPIAGGIGAVDLSTDEPDLKRHARAVAEALEFDGPFQMEFKRDAEDGTARLIEINPRIWGTLDFSIKLGVDFPVQIRDLALGRPVRRNIPYPVGARYRFWFPQAAEAYVQIRRHFGVRATFGIARGSRPRFRDFDWSDPMPDLVRYARVARSLLRSGVPDGLRGLPVELVPLPGRHHRT